MTQLRPVSAHNAMPSQTDYEGLSYHETFGEDALLSAPSSRKACQHVYGDGYRCEMEWSDDSGKFCGLHWRRQ